MGEPELDELLLVLELLLEELLLEELSGNSESPLSPPQEAKNRQLVSTSQKALFTAPPHDFGSLVLLSLVEKCQQPFKYRFHRQSIERCADQRCKVANKSV